MSNKEKLGESRIQRKKNETKQKIITIAMRLFKEYGVQGTTMEQIAQEVDIAKGTLYNYFPLKEAIIDEYIKQSFSHKNSQRIRQLENLPDTKSRWIQVFSELFRGVQEQKEIFEKYLVYRMQNMVSFNPDDSEKSGFYLLGTEIIKLGQKSGEIRTDLPIAVLRELFEFAFIEAVKQFYMEPEKFNMSQAIGCYVDLCMNGVKQEKKS